MNLEIESLEESCRDCDGKGNYFDGGMSGPNKIRRCPFCDGRGRVLTANGEALLSFIRRRVALVELEAA